MRKLSLSFLYTASILMAIGGIGDFFINELLDVHVNFLGSPEQNDLFFKFQYLVLAMLHSIGGNLLSCGVSMFALTHFGIRNNMVWAKWTYLIIALLSQGFNGWGMYSVGSYYFYPVMILIFVLLGVFTFPKTTQSV